MRFKWRCSGLEICGSFKVHGTVYVSASREHANGMFSKEVADGRGTRWDGTACHDAVLRPSEAMNTNNDNVSKVEEGNLHVHLFQTTASGTATDTLWKTFIVMNTTIQ